MASPPELPSDLPPDLDVVGIGNALVDVLSHGDEALLTRQGLVKGTMHLVDEARARELYDAMGPGVEISGGSAANTVVGVASFGAARTTSARCATTSSGRSSATTCAPPG